MEQALKAYQLGSPEEKELLRRPLRNKVLRANLETRRRLQPEINEALK